MTLCSVCNAYPGDADRLCSQCRASKRLVKELALLPASLRDWGLERTRVLTSLVQEERQKAEAAAELSTKEPSKDTPRTGSEASGQKPLIKEELEAKEDALAEVEAKSEETRQVTEPAKTEKEPEKESKPSKPVEGEKKGKPKKRDKKDKRKASRPLSPIFSFS
mmetsp:Transcript_3983/g.4460  ORF Transcript_3983/g.4460 Transcript_3983/m.4460 type:complete len:164 (-) Transcript_3983:126-617(-)